MKPSALAATARQTRSARHTRNTQQKMEAHSRPHLLHFLHALLHVVSDVFDELVDAWAVLLQTPLGLSNSLRADLPELLRCVLDLRMHRCLATRNGKMRIHKEKKSVVDGHIGPLHNEGNYNRTSHRLQHKNMQSARTHRPSIFRCTLPRVVHLIQHRERSIEGIMGTGHC